MFAERNRIASIIHLAFFPLWLLIFIPLGAQLSTRIYTMVIVGSRRNVDHGQETAGLNDAGRTAVSDMATLNLGKKDIRDGIRCRNGGKRIEHMNYSTQAYSDLLDSCTEYLSLSQFLRS